MADIQVQVVLPGGSSKKVDMPDDELLRELLPELVTALEVPTTGPDGRPIGYRLDCKRLGRAVKEDETLAAAGVRTDDTLLMAPNITAGG